ncbi:MAG: flagellar hook-length control protein FliK [Oceanospirillaceae bacterium]|nr:flagellar hook-length control protein FliK [Oceanospirillaceae bacterium]
MDTLAVHQAKVLHSSGATKSIEATLPAGKTVNATLTQISPDQNQPNVYKIKLEINNSVLQISVKLSDKIPLQGSNVSLQRLEGGKIQITIDTEKSAAPKNNVNSAATKSTTNSSPTDKAAPLDAKLINNTNRTESQTNNGKVTLRAPVIINASGTQLESIERALPKGLSVAANIITGSGNSNQPLATNSTLLGNILSATPANLVNSSINQTANNILQKINTQNPPVSPRATTQVTPPPTLTTSSPSPLLGAITRPLPPLSVIASTAPVTTPIANQAGQTAISQPISTAISNQNTPLSPSVTNVINTPSAPVTTNSQAVNLPATPSPTTPAPANTNLLNTANPPTTPLATAGTQPANTPPPASSPAQLTATNTSIASNPSSAQAAQPIQAPTSQAAPSPTVSSTITQTALPVVNTSNAISNTVPNSIPPNQASSSINTPLTPPPIAPSTAVPSPTTPLVVTSSLLSAPAANTTALNQSPPPSNTHTATNITNSASQAPKNLNLQALAPTTTAIKISVAGQVVSLQAPANLPPVQQLNNLQITRSEGVQANIAWQQPSQATTQPDNPFSLNPKQALLVEQSLKQALPQQIPIAEGINQLVAQTNQIATSAVPIDKIALSIMLMFGVKPGSPNASDSVKRNVQQGGLFSENKMLNQPSSVQGDMKNFLAKLNHLAESLPTEQKEMLQSTTERMLARITTNQLTHVQQQHLKADISNERSFQIDIPVQHNEQLDNVAIEIKQRKHLNEEGEFISIWSVKLHFDLEERGEVDAEIAINPTDNSISTTFLCSQLATVQALNRKMGAFREQLSQHGFEIQTLHCTQGSQAAIANNHISKRIVDIRT